MKHHLALSALLLAGTTLLYAQEPSPAPPAKPQLLLSGYAQTGYTYNSADESNTFDIKRIIFMADVRFTERLLTYFMYDFAGGGNLLEIYAEYRVRPELNIRAGQFKTMYSFENPLSPCYTELINCYSQAVSYLAGVNGSDPLYGASSGRDFGLLVYGDLLDKRLSYNLALMNGQGINHKDRNRSKDLVGSLLVNPLPWLSVGGTFQQGTGHAAAVSPFNPGVAAGENYRRNRVSVGALVKTTPVEVRTEYLSGRDADVSSRGYYLSTTVHILPKLDAVASYDFLDKNTDRAFAAPTRQT
ncbi:MAG: porin, partial [Prevotellaceae bacterium]|nr:porin [Prevotellaceae bacterium]